MISTPVRPMPALKTIFKKIKTHIQQMDCILRSQTVLHLFLKLLINAYKILQVVNELKKTFAITILIKQYAK